MTKSEKNRRTADRLDDMVLSQRARDIIDTTDYNCIDECFGFLETAEEVEQFIAENYPEDEE